MEKTVSGFIQETKSVEMVSWHVDICIVKEMKPLQKTYQDIMVFVDSFVNSTTPDLCNPAEMPQDAVAWYATWEDNYIGDFIDNPITKVCLRKVADKYYSSQLDEILQTSSELTESRYPSLFHVFSGCCKKLGMHQMPKAYITGRLQGINALSVEVKGKQLILISRSIVVRLNEKEQAFILGHELGHHQQGNLVCHTVNGLLDTLNSFSEIFGPMIADTIEVSMKRWCRQSEFNADRAGFICCGEIEAVESLLSKITEKKFRTSYTSISELFEDHPLLKTRMKKLIEFSKQLSC